MNNLLLAAVILAGTGAIWVNAHRGTTQARGAIVELKQRSAAVSERANRADMSVRKLERADANEKARAEDLQSAIAQLQARISQELPAPTDPGEEGYWPQDRPYFYLAKRHLESVRYWPISDDDTISETAALLLGMTAAERAEANRVYRRVREEMRELEVSLAVPTNAPPSLAEYKGAKKSILVPELPKEELTKIDANFRAAVADALGSQRGELLARRIAETYDWGAFGMGVNRVITLIKDEDHWRLAVNSGGNFTISYDRDEHGNPRVPKDFAHLFPDDAR